VIVIASSTQRRQSLWLAMLRRRRHQLQITHSARDCALMAPRTTVHGRPRVCHALSL